MSDKILPCPFCGSAGQLHGLGPYFVSCERVPSCCAMLSNSQRTAETAIALWNMRPAAPAREALITEYRPVSAGDPPHCPTCECDEGVNIRKRALVRDGGG